MSGYLRIAGFIYTTTIACLPALANQNAEMTRSDKALEAIQVDTARCHGGGQPNIDEIARLGMTTTLTVDRKNNEPEVINKKTTADQEKIIHNVCK